MLLLRVLLDNKGLVGRNARLFWKIRLKVPLGSVGLALKCSLPH